MRLTSKKFCLCLTSDGPHGVASRRAITHYAMAMMEMGRNKEAQEIIDFLENYYEEKDRGRKHERCDDDK